MMADAYRKGLPVALERGLVTMAQIDESVLRVLHLKERLGLFDDPYRTRLAAGSACGADHAGASCAALSARAPLSC